MIQNLLDRKIERFFGIEVETCWGEDSPTFNYKIEYQKHRDLLLSVLRSRQTPHRRYKVSDYWEGTTSNDYWHIKHDGTCGISEFLNGWEIASFKAKVVDMPEIAWALEEWRKCGIQVNKNCGLHVHIDVSDFSERDMAVLLARWVKIENQFLSLVPIHRREDGYCTPIMEYKKISKTRKYTYSQFLEKVKPTNFSVHRNLQKRVALNTINYFRSKLSYGDSSKCTVEFRFPESTLDWMDVLNWVSIFLIFVETCKGKKMPMRLNPITSDKRFFSYIGVKEENLINWMRVRKLMFKRGQPKWFFGLAKSS